eukprot:TRINITY_DN14839_c0_g1_i1.p1 TRINITY_DN14839_c0_g1~~TRINITY_DN14839_c0_g1_i1.p1  ORF type:complete len:147 (-),score=17.80 TRINITY_DN14839_c0_g1_i1:88-528(-)
MLGGGVPLGKLTEFCGVPGIGKTQMGFQLAVNVSIPNHFGGVEGECIYIDTEGSFMVERLVEIASKLHEHLLGLQAEREDTEDKNDNDNDDDTKDNTKESQPSVPSLLDILSHIHYIRAHDYVEQMALINTLLLYLKDNPKHRLPF